MKGAENLLEQLKPLSHFTKPVIRQLAVQAGLKMSTGDTYISRFLKRKEIISLKKGLYVSADFYLKNRGDVSYVFFLANVLRTPSYVTSWTALQYYNLATESIHTIISATPKVTRSYETKSGNFSYQSMQKDLFTDFVLVKAKFDFFIASPSKALFDLLYSKTRQFRGMNIDEVRRLVTELRVDMDEMQKGEKEKFYSLVKAYMRYE